MNRRDFIQIGALAGAIGSGNTMAATFPSSKNANVVEASVADLQAAMQAGKLTSQKLVKLYLARIRAIDKAGPRITEFPLKIASP